MSGDDDERDGANLDPIDRPRPGEKDGVKPSKTRPPEQDPNLNNPDSTPGTGILPDLSDDPDPNVQPSS